MAGCRYSEDNKVMVPVRTISNPSPPKKTAANRHPGQPHTRTPVDEAIAHELAKARYLMHDLADHVFGHIVSTELARDILRKLVDDKVIRVFEVGAHDNRGVEGLLSPGSNEAQHAIQLAFEEADRHDCINRDMEGGDGNPGTSTDTKGKEKQKTTYKFEWTTFPSEPLQEEELVAFMNDITDRAFAIAKPKLAEEHSALRHRLAAPKDKTHAVPLSYEPDGEDMRPDFLLLPIEAFKDDFKSVDPKYVNFTATRLVGESKNKDVAAGVEQMQRYARGLKRAQPWVHYVLGMAVTKDNLRGEGSGTERLELILSNGRGCIEFIRILLGLALADHEDLGHNPDIKLEGKEHGCVLRNVSHRSGPSRWTKKDPRTGTCTTTSASLSQRPVPSSSALSKRPYSEIDGGDEETEPKKRKTDDAAVEAVRYVFYPICVYGYICIGILFTASSIRGRGTTVFCVVDLRDGSKLLALKMAWQDLGRVAEQEAVMERLSKNVPHPNVIVPIKTFKPKKYGRTCTTLGVIRGFLDDQIEKLFIENRVLTISVSELKRPVKYFWGVHDFVRGLRGALLGHEYITKIGILHRDISENNIVLGRRPGDERGYLIDLDMAILQEPEEPTPAVLADFVAQSRRYVAPNRSESDNRKPLKGLRTGTFPYISYNVLWGRRHTHFDDVESFLYVLLLFFFSYAGPLSGIELRKADENGKYAEWADGPAQSIAAQKQIDIIDEDGATRIIDSDEFVHCLGDQWPNELHDPIRNLILSSFTIFWNSTRRATTKKLRTEVQHVGFIDMLDRWLDEYSGLEDEFSNCPFKQGSTTKVS